MFLSPRKQKGLSLFSLPKVKMPQFFTPVLKRVFLGITCLRSHSSSHLSSHSVAKRSIGSLPVPLQRKMSNNFFPKITFHLLNPQPSSILKSQSLRHIPQIFWSQSIYFV
ncbi:hypothetical protein V8G54_016798 [Vigna mungo]|uniref:Uncharacterized protein n=1 Tax=Vigna mungo TaxID=3915 RepID=A0AAQ3NNM1_VIGMU